MRRKIATILATLMVALGLSVTAVIAAPAASAVTCTWHNQSKTYDSDGGYQTVTAGIYSCDHGSWEELRSFRVTWPNGDTFFRRLYDNGSADTNIRRQCGSSSTWYQWMNRSAYYPSTTYSSTTTCTEPARINVNLTLDRVAYADADFYWGWTF